MTSDVSLRYITEAANQLRLLRSQIRGPFSIGIGGGECSGMTYLSERLVAILAEYKLEVHVIAIDGYLRHSRTERKALAKRKSGIEALAYEIGDHPVCFELQQAREDTQKLVQTGVLSTVQRYDYSRGEVVIEHREKYIEFEAVVIVEGIFALHRTLLDVHRFTYFLEVDSETLLKRYLQRHVAPGHADDDSMKRRFLEAVVPCYKEFIEPTRERACALIDTTPV